MTQGLTIYAFLLEPDDTGWTIRYQLPSIGNMTPWAEFPAKTLNDIEQACQDAITWIVTSDSQTDH